MCYSMHISHPSIKLVKIFTTRSRWTKTGWRRRENRILSVHCSNSYNTKCATLIIVIIMVVGILIMHPALVKSGRDGPVPKDVHIIISSRINLSYGSNGYNFMLWTAMFVFVIKWLQLVATWSKFHCTVSYFVTLNRVNLHVETPAMRISRYLISLQTFNVCQVQKPQR